MTRQEKLQHLREKVAKTKEAMAAFPAFFPAHIPLHVQFGEPQIICRRRTDKGRQGGHPSITVHVKEDWLETVYAKGWAVIERYFILLATPLETLPGCEWVCHFRFLRHGDGWKLIYETRVAVSYGGEVFWSWDAQHAYQQAQEHFTHAITGEPWPEIPF